MSPFIVAFMAGSPATVSVDQAVTPVLVTLLGIVGPVVALRVVLADCLAVGCMGDMLYMLYQRLRIITDNSFCHITGCQGCFCHSSGCWHHSGCRGDPPSCSRGSGCISCISCSCSSCSCSPDGCTHRCRWHGCSPDGCFLAIRQ